MTMTGGRQVFVDTNVLVYATVNVSPFYHDARQALNQVAAQGDSLWISRQVLREFLAVITRPMVFGVNIPWSVALSSVQSFEKQFHVADETSATTAQLVNLLQTIHTHSKQIHDANIVATMRVHNVSHLLTHNVADFNRYARYITIIPLISPTL